MEPNRRGLTELGYILYLDRYALKKNKADYKVGDTALFKFDGSTTLCEITYIDGDEVQIEYTDADGTVVTSIRRDELDVPAELDPVMMWKRVAEHVASTETDKDGWEIKFRLLLEDWKFIPGGRILAAAGVDADLSFYNCYVIPSPKDSKAGIFETANTMSQIMARGGGVGINLSTIRPNYAKTHSTNGRSSGAVSWGELYSVITGLIEQGGSRRGATMLILNDWHPDIEEFIKVKRDMTRITNANISIGISDKFMAAVESGDDWQLIFPDTTHSDYDKDWAGDIEKWRQDKGELAINIHKTVNAANLWNQIIESAWACAEPGLWFKDVANKYSNSWYYAPLVCTNPCGEQPLPDWGVCNLGALNLSKYVDADIKKVLWDELLDDVSTAVRFLDNVIDINPYFMDENKQQQLAERRVGLGTLGLAEMLLKLGMRYGDDDSIEFIDLLYKEIALRAYGTSVELAREKGAFPKFDAELYMESAFIRQFSGLLAESIKKFGTRNVTLLTQAPTGTTGTMVNTSTGIEPYYFWQWNRTGRFGSHSERVPLYDKWVNEHQAGEELPDYFVTAQELAPEDHIKVQATVQQWVDSSISKTCNVPKHYTVAQVGELYKLMYELGCKGGTVYRDQSRATQVLSLETASKTVTRHRPDELTGKTLRKNTPVGTLYLTLNEREDGPFEVFLTVGKAGSELAAQAEALGRLISLILRLPSSDTPHQRLVSIVAQLRDIGSGRALGFGPNRVGSLPDAVAQCLSEYAGITEVVGLPEGEDNGITHPVGDLCPQCGDASFYRIEGCKKCWACGYSEC